ncbi:hypothetical protein AMTRI_Chr04g182000 [Amborella trichopoda]
MAGLWFGCDLTLGGPVFPVNNLLVCGQLTSQRRGEVTLFSFVQKFMHIKMDIFEVSMSGCWVKVCEIC